MAVSEPRRNALETLANDVFVSDDIVNLTNLQIRRSPTAKTQGQCLSASGTTSRPLNKQSVCTEEVLNHHLPRVMLDVEERRVTDQMQNEEDVEAQDPAAASESEYGEDLAIED
ncbi:hypothetical protein RBB50_003376 [Rhinocladiella similis]